jgi:hypothetical protein
MMKDSSTISIMIFSTIILSLSIKYHYAYCAECLYAIILSNVAALNVVVPYKMLVFSLTLSGCFLKLAGLYFFGFICVSSSKEAKKSTAIVTIASMSWRHRKCSSFH